MTHDEYKRLRNGDTCVIIRTGEPGKVVTINRKTDDILLYGKQVGKGVTREWFNYTLLGKYE